MKTRPFVSEALDHLNALRLQNVFLHVTKACNLHCKYCYFSAKKPLPDEMATEEFAELWPQLVELRPQKVVFTGGEPLLRSDILDLLESLKEADPEHHVLRCVNTNGHRVTEQLAQRLVGLADEVRVSLDGLRETNDRLRGRGNFDMAFQALKTFYSAGFEPKVLITITYQSAPDLEELVCLLIDNKLTRIKFNNFRPIGRGQGRSDWQADPKVVEEGLTRAWRRCYPGEPLPEQAHEVPHEQCNCGVGHFLNIMPNGDVFPCHVLTNPEFRCGSLREQSLLEICRANGLLGQLAALDFPDLAKQDSAVSEVARAGTCMGDVYAKTKTSRVWRNALPILGQP